MSTKNTILLTPWCHVYHDYAYNWGSPVWADKDSEVLIIKALDGEVATDAGTHEDGNDVIMVLADSDFAKMLVWMCEIYKRKDNPALLRNGEDCEHQENTRKYMATMQDGGSRAFYRGFYHIKRP